MEDIVRGPQNASGEPLSAFLAAWRGPQLIIPAGSQQVRSSELIAELLPALNTLARQHGPSPMPGTTAWLALPYDDPRRRIGLGWAALCWAIEQDAKQAAIAGASRAVSAAGDWAEIARAAAGRRSTSYIPRKDAAA